jgi:alpha/beta superfamily hydrolase
MFRKVAIALVAASVFAAPVMAQTPAATDTKPANKPAASAPATTGNAASTTTDKSAPSTTVKTNKSKSDKHSRVIRRHTRTVSHKPVMTVKHARHFHAAKSHKVAGTAHKVVSAKSATRSSVN